MTHSPAGRPRLLALIGLRGVGKSAVGVRLAARLGLEFVDTDDLVQRRAGKSIAAIFADEGEARFRELEAAAVADAVSRPGRIVSVGGGAILRAESRQLLRARAICIQLTAPVDELARRLAHDAQSSATRPALTDLPPEAEIARLFEQRAPLYAEIAHATVETAGRTIDAVCDEVLAAISG